ncbi:hypothetical protein [Spiroplasma culicicola]|uniref:Energy-coupling factor transport system substrate-specific component n=1 Tax=Spiroplasma culicicola AES-1 TaxID=1276246 RepID=W6A8H7_9MOLU|nr:hypothetical protein [Spiroplasma culicicola]AHI53266.1 hypothetical protein SCULI_v1c09260 [Spiroplasma culicicola AES-1]
MIYNNNLRYTYELTLIGIYAAMVFGLQVVLAFIPNVEFVTLMIAYATIIFRFKMAFIITIIFCTLEGLMYGFGDWILLYFIIWPALNFLVYALKKTKTLNKFSFILLCTLFGLLFGFVDALIKIIFFDQYAFWAYWIRGIIFDVVHGVSNCLIAYFFYDPLMKLWNNNLKKYLE